MTYKANRAKIDRKTITLDILFMSIDKFVPYLTASTGSRSPLIRELFDGKEIIIIQDEKGKKCQGELFN